MVRWSVGPLEPSDSRERATQLVTALVPGPSGDEGAFQSGTDLNGDGSPDVVVRNERGVMEMWGLAATGAMLYPIAMEVAPTRAIDVDEDGKIDFAGEVEVLEGDPIAPRLEDAAAFRGATYSNATAGVRAWHARRADALAAGAGMGVGVGAGAGAGTGAGTGTATDAVRARRAIELAWHRILSGSPRKSALEKLDKEAVPPDLRDPFQRYRRRISRIGLSSAPDK